MRKIEADPRGYIILFNFIHFLSISLISFFTEELVSSDFFILQVIHRYFGHLFGYIMILYKLHLVNFLHIWFELTNNGVEKNAGEGIQYPEDKACNLLDGCLGDQPDFCSRQFQQTDESAF